MNNTTDRRSKLLDDAAELLHRLHLAGVTFNIAPGGGLGYDAPAEAVTDDTLDELRRLKRPCLFLLNVSADFAWTDAPRPSPPVVVVTMTADPSRPDRARLLRRARAAGWPSVTLPGRPAEAVAGTRADWRRFAHNVAAADVTAVLATMPQRAMVAGRARGIYDEQAKERLHAAQERGRESAKGTPVTLPESKTGDARDLAGKAAGVSGTYVDRATRAIERAVPATVTQGRVGAFVQARQCHDLETTREIPKSPCRSVRTSAAMPRPIRDARTP